MKRLMGAMPEPRILGALAATIFFWASAFVGIRAALEAYEPGEIALGRLAVASVALLVYAVMTRMRLPEARDLPAVVLAGFLAFSVYHTALNYGEITVGAGPASLLIGTAPIFTAILATLFLGERLRALGWAGLAVSFLGVALISFGESEGFGLAPGAFFILLAAVSVSLYLILQRPYLRKYGALAFTSYAVWAGTLFTLIFLPGMAESVGKAPLEATLALLYMGIFPTAIAYVAYAYVFSRMPASTGVSFLYLVPATTFLLAWAYLGEEPTLLPIAGGVLALTGVLMVNYRRR